MLSHNELQLDIFRKTVAEWFSYIMLYRVKYLIDHRQDPEWDCSGIACNYGVFRCSDYKYLSDFFQENTGNSTATYTSGCGLSYDTYEKAFREVAQEHCTEILKKYVKIDYLGEDGEIFFDDSLPIYKRDDEDSFYDLLEECICYLTDFCESWLCAELLNEGALDAVEVRSEEYALVLEANAKIYQGQLLAKKYDIDLDEYMCKNSHNWNALKAKLLKLPKEERKLIARVMNVSNSIRYALIGGKLSK